MSRPYALPSPPQSFNSTVSNSVPSRPQAHFTSSDQSKVQARNDQAWYPDSGATNHVTHNPNNLLDSISLPGSDQVLLGNGQGLSITSIGNIHFTSPHSPQTTLALKNLLLVPEITKNLLSVSQFAKDNGVYFKFHPTFCLVKSQATFNVLLRGTLGHDGLYSFGDLFSATSSSSNTGFILPFTHTVSPSVHSTSIHFANCYTAPSSPVNTHTHTTTPTTSLGPTVYTMWHYRLGYPHHEALMAALSLCKVQVPNKTLGDFCSSCCLGKAHRLPSFTSTTAYNLPFELLFCDLWGPAPMVSACNYKYMLTIVDACTKYTWTFPLKLKSDTYGVFKQFKVLVEVQFNTKIKSVQTDGGGEFTALAPFFAECGIQHRLTCPHTHH